MVGEVKGNSSTGAKKKYDGGVVLIRSNQTKKDGKLSSPQKKSVTPKLAPTMRAVTASKNKTDIGKQKPLEPGKKPVKPETKPGFFSFGKEDKWVGITAIILAVAVIILLIVFVSILIVKSNTPIKVTHEQIMKGRLFALSEDERIQILDSQEEELHKFKVSEITETHVMLLTISKSEESKTTPSVQLEAGENTRIPLFGSAAGDELFIKLESVTADEEENLRASVIFRRMSPA